MPVQSWGESSTKGNKLYLHVFDWPEEGKLVVGGLKNSIKSAYLLSDKRKKELRTSHLNNSDVVIRVPRSTPDSADSVVVVEFEGPLITNPTRLLSSDQPNQLRTFDGELHGSGLRFGDGKSFRAYVLDWKNMTEWVSWKTR